MYMTALHSAVKNTKLTPILIYDGTDKDFVSSVKALGGRVHNHIFSGATSDAFQAHTNEWKGIAEGTFLRLDIPQVCEAMGIYDKYVLYTDADVLFLDDPTHELEGLSPQFFAACPESDKENWSYVNVGILLLNMETMTESYDDFMHHVNSTYQDIGFDQVALNTFYRGRIDRLPLSMNHKPYWGTGDPAFIVHFHGPKPADIEHFLKTGNCIEEYRPLFSLVDRDVWADYIRLWNGFRQG